MNSVMLTGNLTQDAQLLEFNNGSRKVIKFTLAVNRNFKNSNGQREADFIPVVYFINHPQRLVPYLKKGTRISVLGRLNTHTFIKQDGSKRYYLDIVANSIEFLGSKKTEAL